MTLSDRENILNILARSAVFRDLPKDTLDAATSVVRTLVVPPHTIIFREGDPGDSLYIISKGKVRIFRKDSSGMEIDLATLGPGNTFGEMALLSGETRSAGVEVLEEAHLVALAKDDFDRILRDFPGTAKIFFREMRRRLLTDEKRLEVEAVEAYKASRVSWFDFVVVVGVSILLAMIFNYNRLPDKALEVLHDPITNPSQFALTEYNSTELNWQVAAGYIGKNKFLEAADLLEIESSHHPDDTNLPPAIVQALFAGHAYTNALDVINRRLARTPDALDWIYGKAFASLQIGAYDDAAKSFTRVLEIQTNNPDALYNRAFAIFKSDHLDAARADFRQLQATYTNEFHVAYGLGEIAWRQHETNEAVRNYQIYLANAPTNSAELKTVRERLTQIGGQ